MKAMDKKFHRRSHLQLKAGQDQSHNGHSSNRPGQGLEARIIELVRFLARCAAEEDYRQMRQENEER